MSPVMSPEKSDAQAIRQARIDLAATLRWADRLGLSEGICNHFSLLVPGQTDQFLLNPQGLHWSEIRAGDLLIVDSKGNLIEGDFEPEPTAFFIHSRIHMGIPKAKCVLHVHAPYTTALCCIEGGGLEWCSQNSLRYYGRVAYDGDYNGMALDNSEGDRICSRMGNADIVFLAAHGVVVTGENLAYAFDDLYYLERAAMNQVIAMSTGRPLKIIPDEICRATAEQIGTERQQSDLHLEAIRRILMKECPEFADQP
jgi:ribulose-5-phosphate 4-epimerase/fuculose-1-phosphate aldolase